MRRCFKNPHPLPSWISYTRFITITALKVWALRLGHRRVSKYQSRNKSCDPNEYKSTKVNLVSLEAIDITVIISIAPPPQKKYNQTLSIFVLDPIWVFIVFIIQHSKSHYKWMKRMMHFWHLLTNKKNIYIQFTEHTSFVLVGYDIVSFSFFFFFSNHNYMCIKIFHFTDILSH